MRSSRKTDTIFKRKTAELYYHILHLLGVDIVYNHADYRLLSSRVLDALSEFKEVNIFLRGIIPLIGFKSTTVEYVRLNRQAGSTHYPLRKMVSLAFDGISSLSSQPIHMIATAGAFLSIVGFIGIIWAIFSAVLNRTFPGWASIICFIGFFGGLQLLSLGIIGEYVGKIYLEVKQRPRYIIAEKTTNFAGNDHA